MLAKLSALKVTVPVNDVDVFLRAARGAGWQAVDTRERVTTEGGLESETVVVLHVPVEEAPHDVITLESILSDAA